MALTNDQASSSLFSANVAGTLRLFAYLGLACILMVLDHRFLLLQQVRQTGAVLVEPVFVVAALPARVVHAVTEAITNREQLLETNQQLRRALLLAEARINRMQSIADQNRRYRKLLAVKGQLQFSVQTARLVGVDLGPYRHRVLINAGRNQGVEIGMTVLDASGVMGQVVEVGLNTSQVMLITDPNHAIPVVVQRTNLHLIAYGAGRSDQLNVRAIPLSADVRPGDRLLTSGLGGRFPAGFPVGRIQTLDKASDGVFQVAAVRPAADFGRSMEVLLLRDQSQRVGPPAPALSVGPPARLSMPASPVGERQ